MKYVPGTILQVATFEARKCIRATIHDGAL